MLQQFDYSKESTEKEFTVAACNPSGQIAVVGSFNRYFKFKKKHYCKSNQ
jgi:intraflagellar transport protein 172